MNSTKGKSWSDLINKVHENYDKVKEKELLSFRSNESRSNSKTKRSVIFEDEISITESENIIKGLLKKKT